jgi:hypothetical protein
LDASDFSVVRIDFNLDDNGALGHISCLVAIEGSAI